MNLQCIILALGPSRCYHGEDDPWDVEEDRAMAKMAGIAVIAGLGLAMSAVSIEAKADSRSERMAADPNEKVCENIKVIGSRLAVKRVCATRAEWKEKRKLDREVVDDAQRHAADPCNATLTHTGPAMC
jgi:hypothetical protein